MDIPIDAEGRYLHVPNRYVAMAAAGLVVLVGLLTSVYTVATDERALVLRFGKHVDTSPPGLHFRAPFGVDRVIKIPVERVDVEQFGLRDAQVPGGRPRRIRDELIMLTGDLNIVFVGWDVQYRRTNPEDYAFHVEEPIATLRDVAMTEMREIVGDRASLMTLTEERGEIQEDARRRIQDRSDAYNMGIRVEIVNLTASDPPEQVTDSFHDLNRAGQDAARFLQEANQEYEAHVPRAQGSKLRRILEAEGYQTRRVQEAEGAAEYFTQVLDEYLNYPEVTWIRLYLETIREVLPELDRVFVVEDTGGVVPLLDLLKQHQSGGGR